MLHMDEKKQVISHLPASAIVQVPLRAAFLRLPPSLHKAGLVPQHPASATCCAQLPWLHLPAKQSAHSPFLLLTVQILLLQHHGHHKKSAQSRQLQKVNLSTCTMAAVTALCSAPPWQQQPRSGHLFCSQWEYCILFLNIYQRRKEHGTYTCQEEDTRKGLT